MPDRDAPYFYIDNEDILLMGGAADGKKITIKRGVDTVQLNCVEDWIPGSWSFWGKGTVPERPRFKRLIYKRLAETHIFRLE